MAYGTYTNSGSVQLNAGILGGIVTGSEAGEFLGFPVSGTAINTTAVGVEAWITAGGPKRQLSSSFEGFTGSLIQSLNFLKASINTANDAAGSNTWVQYNDSGEFGAEAGFTYTAGTDTLAVVNVNLTKMTASGDVQIDDILQLADSKLTIGGTAVTSTGAEINLVDGSSAGTVVASKAVIYDSNGDLTGNAVKAASGTFSHGVSGTIGRIKDLILGGTAVTSTATELNYNDGVTPGTAAATKTVILDGSKDISGLNTVSMANLTASGDVRIDDILQIAASKLTIGGTAVTSTGAELNYVDIASLGTAAASKALVLDTNEAIAGVGGFEADAITASVSVKVPVGGLTLGSTAVGATAAELDYNDGVTAGAAAASKTLVLDSYAELGINGAAPYAISANWLTGSSGISTPAALITEQLVNSGDTNLQGTCTVGSLTSSVVLQAASGTFVNALVAQAGMQVATTLRTRYLNISGTNGDGDGKEYQIEVVGGLLVATQLN
jgi:hypothetical protein